MFDKQLARKAGSIVSRHASQCADDDIIALVSSLLEYNGFVDTSPSSAAKNGYADNPWNSLADDVDNLVVLLSKISKVHSAENVQDNYQLDELFLKVEETARSIHDKAESLSSTITKDIPVQLGLCHELELCSPANLCFLAKSLEGAFRQQHARTLQSLSAIQRCLPRIYHPRAEMGVILKLQSRSLRQRCIDRKGSPWNDALRILDRYLASAANMPGGDDQTTIIVDRSQKQTVIAKLQPTKFDIGEACPISSGTFLGRSLLESVDEIMHRKSDYITRGKSWSFLLVGAEGAGKSFLLREIAAKARDNSFDVIWPSLPFDAMGATVGAAEDLLISMICCAKTCSKRCLLVLDDIDNICGELETSGMVQDKSAGRREHHITARVRSVFLSLLDTIRERNDCLNNGELVLICSSKENFGTSVDRFDRIFRLGPPSEEERRSIIFRCLQLDLRNQHLEVSFSNLVDCTSGLSRSELAQVCRDALLTRQSAQAQEKGVVDILNIAIQNLQSATPDSLRSGVNEGFVDIKVFSARDLQRLYPIDDSEDPTSDLPLFGESARVAWKELRRLIVLPVCQGEALNKLLFHRGDGPGRKVFAGGVLLAASPGTGKSTLAYFCAAFAAAINPSVKLIDVSCTSLIHKEVGSSERAVHRLFQNARAATPCIVVMDGIENIAAVRGNDNTTEGTMDRVLSALLTELDGVESEQFSRSSSSSSMAIIGITHNPKWIDPALRRPGRLEKVIELEAPDLKARKQIILKELCRTTYESDDSYPVLLTLDAAAERVAMETNGFAGAGVIAVCNEAKLLASKSFFYSSATMSEPIITPSLLFRAVEAYRAGMDC